MFSTQSGFFGSSQALGARVVMAAGAMAVAGVLGVKSGPVGRWIGACAVGAAVGGGEPDEDPDETAAAVELVAAGVDSGVEALSPVLVVDVEVSATASLLRLPSLLLTLALVLFSVLPSASWPAELMLSMGSSSVALSLPVQTHSPELSEEQVQSIPASCATAGSAEKSRVQASKTGFNSFAKQNVVEWLSAAVI